MQFACTTNSTTFDTLERDWLVQPKFERLWPSPSPIPLPTADVALSKLLTDEQTKNSLAKKKIVDTDHMVFACAQLIYLEFWQLNS